MKKLILKKIITLETLQFVYTLILTDLASYIHQTCTSTKFLFTQLFIADSILTQSFKVCYQAVHGCKKSSFNRARNEHGGSYSNEMVDGVIAVMRVIPVFILVIIYWAVYSQVNLPFSFSHFISF